MRNKLKLVLLALLLTACATPQTQPDTPTTPLPGSNTSRTTNPYVSVYHDDMRGVTCWIFNYSGTAGGISCLPDRDFGR